MKTIYSFIFFILAAGFLSSCATIVGGSKYIAHVKVNDHPKANIEYMGINQGKGNASFKVKRSQANKFSVILKEDGCEDQTYNFKQRTFRGWAFVGTVVTWTGLINGIPLPWGVAVDLATGALWKPNINEKGVSKLNYKNYIYKIDNYKCVKKDAEN